MVSGANAEINTSTGTLSDTSPVTSPETADGPAMEQVPALPSQFHSFALAFPNACKRVVAHIDAVDDAVDALARTRAIEQYAQTIKASVIDTNHIQHGRLILEAKIGQLCAPEKGGRGKKKNSRGTPDSFSSDTLTDFRKLATHCHRIDEYAEKKGGDGDTLSRAGFFRFVGSDGNLKSNQNKGVIEWYPATEMATA
jgi:hypothetical protein